MKQLHEIEADGGPAGNARRRAQIDYQNQLAHAVRTIHEQGATWPVARIVVPDDPFGMRRGV